MRKRVTSTFDRIRRPLQAFIRWEAAGGLGLMATTVLAMLVANSPLRDAYEALLSLPLEFRLGTFKLAKPLFLWINDGLMTIFFLLVGLELKREIVEGHLSSLRHVSFPAFAAFGGMLVPALLYTAFNWGDPDAMRGWAIPSATDIAFALGVLSLLGKRVPTSLKAFLLSVAIFDDLGAILVIALFYTAKLSLLSLSVAGVLILGLVILNRLHVTRAPPYFLLGLLLWVAVLKSGVHATLAGVVLAMFIPLKETPHPPYRSLLKKLEHRLHPWVAFGVLPIFAFANAGVPLAGLSLYDMFQPIPLGIMVGLFLGKQMGVLLFAFLAVRLGLAAHPEGVKWRQLYGIALLCGIGFTMSLFIASLAFEQRDTQYLGLERLGILAGSLTSGLVGFFVLSWTLRQPPSSTLLG